MTPEQLEWSEKLRWQREAWAAYRPPFGFVTRWSDDGVGLFLLCVRGRTVLR